MRHHQVVGLSALWVLAGPISPIRVTTDFSGELRYEVPNAIVPCDQVPRLSAAYGVIAINIHGLLAEGQQRTREGQVNGEHVR